MRTLNKLTHNTWFGIATSMAVLAAVLVLLSFNGWRQGALQIETSQQIVRNLAQVENAVAGSAASIQGYLLRGQSDELQAFHNAQSMVPDLLASLREQFGNSSQHQDSFQQFVQLTTQIFAGGEQIVVLIDRGEKVAAADVLQTQSLIRTDKSLRLSIGNIQSLLEQQSRETSRSNTLFSAIALSAAGVLFVLSLGILTVVFRKSREQLKLRTEGETSLRMSNYQLRTSVGRLERLSQDISRLNEMSEFLQSCRTRDEAVSVLAQALPELLPGTSGTLYVLKASNNQMVPACVWPLDSGNPGPFVPDECWSLRRGSAHISTQHGGNVACSHVSNDEWHEAADCVRCQPLAAQGETLGVLMVRAESEKVLGEDLRHLIVSLGDQMALALANLNLQESLRTQSIRDPLTHLYNRRYMEESLQRELARAQRANHPVAVMMLDVDHFKRFNDTHGHEAGDVILAEFASTLMASARVEDIVCRYGGEEFLIILPGLSAENALQRAEEIRRATEAISVRYNKHQLGNITTSIGVAMFPEDGSEEDAVVFAADEALYQAKHDGRNRVVMATVSQHLRSNVKHISSVA